MSDTVSLRLGGRAKRRGIIYKHRTTSPSLRVLLLTQEENSPDELTIEITRNTTIDIEWDYTEANPTLLTIKHANYGCIKMQVDEWETYKFNIEPAEGWSIIRVQKYSFSLEVTKDGRVLLIVT